MSDVYQFGRFELNLATRQLLIDKQPAVLGARAFDLLLALIQRRDRLVSKGELLSLVWPGLVVEENNLQVQVSTLRKVLGQDAIITVPGRGYRFSMQAETVVHNLPAAQTRQTSKGADWEQSALLVEVSALRQEPGLFRHVAPLIGREADQAAVDHLLDDHNLVTIVGAGGVGKTRLAEAVAYRRRDLYPQGVIWVELAPISDPSLVTSAIASALGVQPAEDRDPAQSLIDAVHNMSVLLVVDNAEHLLKEVARVAKAIVTGTPRARVLVTSRAPLGLREEVKYRLGGLSTPDSVMPAQQAESHGAIALFVTRARGADRRFQLTDRHVATVIEICRRLDGMPLAIELASARVPSLGLAALCNRLDEQLKLLATASPTLSSRQQTILATLNWSYELLSEPERRAFCRLGVFPASFTLDACHAVTCDAAVDEWAAIDALGSLIDKSMVVADGNEPPRYYLLETARHYAVQKLSGTGDLAAVQRRHAAYLSALFAAAHRDWLMTPEAEWRGKIFQELNDLRAALSWTFGPQGDRGLGVELAANAIAVWLVLSREHHVEIRKYLEMALNHLSDATPPDVEARLMFGKGFLLARIDIDQAREAFKRAIELFEQTGDDRGLVHALVWYARVLAVCGEIDLAERVLEDANVPLRKLHAPALKGVHCLALGLVCGMRGRKTEAVAHFNQAVVKFAAGGAESLRVMALSDIAEHAWSEGDLTGAAMGFRESLNRARGSYFGTTDVISMPLMNLVGVLTEHGKMGEALAVAREMVPSAFASGRAWLAHDSLSLRLALVGRYVDAARLHGRSLAAYAAANIVEREPNERRIHDRVARMLRDKFAEAELKDLLAEGAALTDEQAYRLALDS